MIITKLFRNLKYLLTMTAKIHLQTMMLKSIISSVIKQYKFNIFV